MIKMPYPLLLCSFRPFFVLTASAAVLLVFFWLLILQGHALPITLAGGWVAWHAHELLFGVIGAATAGFILTAVPEFTQTDFMRPWPLAILAIIWLIARFCYLLSPGLGLWPAMIFNALFWLFILARIGPPCWQYQQRRHFSFVLVISLLALSQLLYFSLLLQQRPPLTVLYVSVHLYMILIVVAASRVSMSVLNNLVEVEQAPTQFESVAYIARPPKRNLAISAIALCALSEWFWGPQPITAWTALAAMAAILHLLSDWHIGRPLLHRWSLLLYIGYWWMALGYAALAASYFGAPLMPSAARHVLMLGSMGGFILTIMCIVGRIHSGLQLDRRVWIPIAAALLVGATLLRLLAGYHDLLSHYSVLLLGAGLLWCAAFLLYGWYFFAIFFRPRPDGQAGCAGPLKAGPEHGS